MLLSVKNLSVARGGRTLISGLSFDLNAGECLGVRGPNGVGKTTVLRSLAGLQPVAYGAVNADPEQIVYAGHLNGIKATLSVGENLKFWADIYGQENIDHALGVFDLKALINKDAGTLSAGQMRRLGLARLLVSERKIWILDEPTVSLDMQSVDAFSAIVTQHLYKGGAAIIATHIDLGEISNLKSIDLLSYRSSQLSAFNSSEAFL